MRLKLVRGERVTRSAGRLLEGEGGRQSERATAQTLRREEVMIIFFDYIKTQSLRCEERE